MNGLFSPGPRREPLRRRCTTMAASAALHVAVVAALFAVARATGLVETERPSNDLTFVEVLPAPVRPPLHLPPIVKEQVRFMDAPAAGLEPPPPERDVARTEPAPPVPAPEPAPPVVADTPRPAPPKVTVGAFEPGGATARASDLARPLQPAGFDAPSGRARDVATRTAAVGAFEPSSARGRPQAGTDRSNVVGDAGFGAGIAAASARAAGRVVADGGFNAGQGGGGKGPPPPPVPKATEFDTRAAQPAAPQAPRPPRTDVPLEILSKPTPAYTDEARALKIEGEVLLDVEFAATGEIRVLRVVRGLGHGLDESASRAVRGMRFKPALRNGQPIDVRMTVSIVFRLA